MLVRIKQPRSRYESRTDRAVLIVLGVAVFCIVMALSACAPEARSEGTPTIRLQYAPDGAKCYVISNAAGDAVGGNCVP